MSACVCGRACVSVLLVFSARLLVHVCYCIICVTVLLFLHGCCSILLMLLLLRTARMHTAHTYVCMFAGAAALGGTVLVPGAAQGSEKEAKKKQKKKPRCRVCVYPNAPHKPQPDPEAMGAPT
eukprot:GHVU01210314.1.p1 GENE.GHVU01210314.1~~GHVU01210314.1.p1  ORF type:complete len:123 (-),score=15.14 GHVU01210314.1:43-411(-)